jgi:histidinol dehydrogenase
MVKRLSELTGAERKRLLERGLEIDRVLPVVKNIFTDVEKNGDAALRKYTKKFDGADVANFAVSEDEISSATRSMDKNLVEQMKFAARNIVSFHKKQVKTSWESEVISGIFLGQKIVPLGTVGAYIPKGYFSTALMIVIPAKLAGVRRIVLCTPPGKNGKVDAKVLVAADIAGADEIYKVGGAQAIAAMCFGTESVPKVEKIAGPGNAYVTAAKVLARTQVEIDFPAGPSEIAIVADGSADADFVAADLLSQLEHGKDSLAVLLTDSAELAKKVERKTKGTGIFLVDTIDEAVEFINECAPEHLELIVKNPLKVMEKVENAGSVLVGNYAPAAASDYASGANHVLPTAGYAKVFSALGVNDFTKSITVQRIEKEGLEKIRDTVVRLARAEGMKKHAESVDVRFRRKK